MSENKVMELYLVRHGQTDWNKMCRFQGRTNTELNENGINAAVALGKRLATEGVRFERIYSSPLNRAFTTAGLICKEIYKDDDYEIIKDDRIVEISFGTAEGIEYKDWYNTDNPRKNFFDKPGEYVPPEGGESFPEICELTKAFCINEIEPLYKDFAGKRILVVAHGACLASLMCYLDGRSVDTFWGNGLKGNCEETVYLYDGKSWKLK